MNFTPAGLITLISLVNRSNNADVVRRAKASMLLPKVVRPLCAGVVVFAMLRLFDTKGPSQAAAIAALVVLASALANYINGKSVDVPSSGRIRMLCTGMGVVAMLFAGAIKLQAKEDLLSVALWSGGSFFAAWVLVFLLSLATVLGAALLSFLMNALASPLAVPLLSVAAFFNRRTMRVKHPDWVTKSGRPILDFNRDGLKQVNHEGEAMYLSSPALHVVAGTALAATIPLFTQNELTNSSLINERMSEVFRNDAWASSFSSVTDMPMPQINPATGLLMMGEGIGGFDVGGSPFGFDAHHTFTPDMGNHDVHAGGGLDHGM